MLQYYDKEGAGTLTYSVQWKDLYRAKCDFPQPQHSARSPTRERIAPTAQYFTLPHSLRWTPVESSEVWWSPLDSSSVTFCHIFCTVLLRASQPLGDPFADRSQTVLHGHMTHRDQNPKPEGLNPNLVPNQNIPP